MHNGNLIVLFIFYIIISSVCFAQEDNHQAFRAADLNHNGVLEESEFKSYSNSVWAALRPFLDFEQGEDGGGPPPAVASYSPFSIMKGFWNAFGSGLITIWATEVGDKTFFIAAILSMRHERSIVFAGAISALIVMTVLSVALGGVVGYFLPQEMTHYAGTVLFVFFGIRMLNDARSMEDAKPSEELAEVEEELEDKKKTSLEDGASVLPTTTTASSASLRDSQLKVLSQGFVMTFLAEWGDRSQIATITLSTTKNALGVIVGAVVGHSMCTGLAVVGGKMLATRISEKTVTLVGGVLFLFFGAHSLVMGPQ